MCLPDFDAGAMENWGLILYKEYYMLFDELLTGPYYKYRITQVVAHELAHQVSYIFPKYSKSAWFILIECHADIQPSVEWGFFDVR